MAEVFKAKTYAHGGFENLLVIKRILAHLGEDDAFVAMFVDEAKVSVALQHPNIVRVFDFGRIYDNFFIAMEFVDGKDLRQVLQKVARSGAVIPSRFAAWIVLEACRGLHYAHVRVDAEGEPLDIVHRDISPSNILISYEGDVRIADFGIAKTGNVTEETDHGALAGKYEYMSPEQACGKRVDRRTDIFALGTILWEMLTGHRAFRADDVDEVLRKIKELEIPRAGVLNPHLPESVDELLALAMALNPDKRFQTAQAFGEAVRLLIKSRDPASLRDEMGEWVRHLFHEEIEADKARLVAGCRTADELREALQARGVWSDNTGPTHATFPGSSAGARSRLLPLMGAALAGVTVLLGVSAFSSLSRSDVPPVMVASTGSLEFDLTPASRVFVSGRLQGEGAVVSVGQLPPGTYEVRVEADGMEPRAAALEVARGASTRVRWTLEEVPRTASVVFESNPTGATVWLDGVPIGTTPFTWVGEPGGEPHRVELRLDGHVVVKGELTDLQAGQERTFKSELRRPVARRPGSLTVALDSVPWAHVWVDGKRLVKTAPLSEVALAPGVHTVKVVNEAAAFSYETTVTVTAGNVATVRAR